MLLAGRPCVPSTMHQSWPWLVFQLGVTATVSWTTVATWFGSGDEERPLGLCAAGDELLECNPGHQRGPEWVRAPSPDVAGPRRLEDIKIIDDLAPRRRRNVPPPANGTKPPPEANRTKDGDLGVHPPADYWAWLASCWGEQLWPPSVGFGRC